MLNSLMGTPPIEGHITVVRDLLHKALLPKPLPLLMKRQITVIHMMPTFHSDLSIATWSMTEQEAVQQSVQRQSASPAAAALSVSEVSVVGLSTLMEVRLVGIPSCGSCARAVTSKCTR